MRRAESSQNQSTSNYITHFEETHKAITINTIDEDLGKFFIIKIYIYILI